MKTLEQIKKEGYSLSKIEQGSINGGYTTDYMCKTGKTGTIYNYFPGETNILNEVCENEGGFIYIRNRVTDADRPTQQAVD